MKIPKRFLLVVGLLVVALALAACTGGAAEPTEAPTEAPAEQPTEAPAEEPTVAPAPTEAPAEQPTEAPAEEPTEAPTEEAMAGFEPISVAAENCDYGGKIDKVEALDEFTVQYTLCGPDPAFLAKMAFTPFAVQPKEWLEETGGTGELLEHPIGTGPYMIQEWVRGDSIVFNRFDDYWGDPAYAETAVLRWNQEGAARLVELQAGTVDMITNPSPDDWETVQNDANLQLVINNNPNIFYLGFTISDENEPFYDQMVRQAIAMGIDRQRIIDNFYPVGSEVASHFTPCLIPNGCAGEDWYEFDPEAARQMLADAGYPDGFSTKIYLRDVFRVYLPEPQLVAVELQTQLMENLGIDAEIVVMESGEFIDASTSGDLTDGMHMLGWGADYPHITNFLDFHFNRNYTQFGTPFPEIYEPLEEASQIGDPTVAEPLYAEANNAVKEFVPMIPIAHGTAADAALATLEGAYTPPFGATQFYKLDPGKDTLVYMQNNEPISLYCADESDGESLRPCQQVTEALLEYADDSGDTVPELATSCESNEDGSVWTCYLREGVKFHDGSDLDANDVVFSFAVGIDAANPLHVGNTGSFDYYVNLWDGLINAPPSE
jgi:peptide/nickel transport system substrate-binding protein